MDFFEPLCFDDVLKARPFVQYPTINDFLQRSIVFQESISMSMNHLVCFLSYSDSKEWFQARFFLSDPLYNVKSKVKNSENSENIGT